MKNDELDEFAAKFINLWQENFHKAIADRKIIDYMMQAAANMQQFYDNKSQDQPFAAAFSGAFPTWPMQHDRGELERRIDELEQRLAALEKGKSAPRPKNQRRGEK